MNNIYGNAQVYGISDAFRTHPQGVTLGSLNDDHRQKPAQNIYVRPPTRGDLTKMTPVDGQLPESDLRPLTIKSNQVGTIVNQPTYSTPINSTQGMFSHRQTPWHVMLRRELSKVMKSDSSKVEPKLWPLSTNDIGHPTSVTSPTNKECNTLHAGDRYPIDNQPSDDVFQPSSHSIRPTIDNNVEFNKNSKCSEEMTMSRGSLSPLLMTNKNSNIMPKIGHHRQHSECPKKPPRLGSAYERLFGDDVTIQTTNYHIDGHDPYRFTKSTVQPMRNLQRLPPPRPLLPTRRVPSKTNSRV